MAVIKNSRIVSLNGDVNEISALEVIVQMLELDAKDNKEPIHLYINSPGGSIIHGLAIYDTINNIDAPVYTYCYGLAASMGAFLLCCGEKGHRYALPNSRILIHQPLISGQARLARESKIREQADDMKQMRTKLESIIAKQCGKNLETVHKDCERDNWMSAKEAKEYGLIDQVL